jgi:curved DNA-binding protein CbpA
MGAAQSQIDPRHLGIYKKLLAIQNPTTRLQMIDTLMGDTMIVHSAKVGGIYGNILQYAAAVRHGSSPAPLPGETQRPAGPSQLLPNQPNQPNQLQHTQGSFQRPVQQIQQKQQQHNQHNQHNQLVAQGNVRQEDPYQRVSKPKTSEKALNFFSACLRVLNIQEEIALTEDALKAAYKKAVIRAHPDKSGGSKEAFDAVTRAYAYLIDILKLVQGRQTRGDGGGGDAAPQTLDSAVSARQAATQDWQMPTQPIKLNPKNLNMKAFNEMFEQTRIPDPDEDGYGDWLKGADTKGGAHKGAKKFSEEFNRDVFNRMFEEEAGNQNQTTSLQKWNQPQEMTLSVGMGVELGRDRPQDYTAAPNSKSQFTDLRAAYTTENTVSNQIQGVRVENRDFNSYKAQRERAPDAYSQSEMSQLQAYEAHQKQKEEQRRLRAAQEQLGARDYFERMKQLVITEK